MAKRGRPKKSKILEQAQEIDKNEKHEGLEILNKLEKEQTKLSKEQIERKDKLNNVLRELNKSKKGIINYASEIGIKERQSFGYKCLDKLTGGGIIRGNFSVIYGHKGTSKTSIAYKMIATCQQEGKIACYLDIERSYDPEWAKKFGVDIEKLIYIACHTAEEILDTLIKLCKEKVVDLVVLDSIQGLSPRAEQMENKSEKEKSLDAESIALLARKLSQFFRMSTAYVSEAKCAVLLIGQIRTDLGSFIKMDTLSGGRALLHNSRLILKVRRGAKVDAPREKIEQIVLDEEGEKKKKKVDKIVGFDCVVGVEKSQTGGCVENEEVHVPFYYDGGIKE
jgi:recombination protein RecA